MTDHPSTSAATSASRNPAGHTAARGAGTAATGDTVAGVSGAEGCGIVIVTGLGDTRWTWRPVETSLDGFGPVVVADRPRHDSLPTLAGETGALRELVVGHGLIRPFLVAHSFGAFIAEAYARRWPVSGLLLVDPSWDPGADSRGRVGRAVASGLFRAAVAGGHLLDATGLARRLGPVAWRLSVRAMALRRPSAGVAAAATSVYRRGETLAAAAAEELAFRDVAAALVALRSSVPVVEAPVVVLTAVGVSAESGDSRHWIASHRRLAALFSRGRHEIVRGSGHMVHIDRPEVIVRQVHRCLSG